ncbi:MAG: hypothetical protein ACD_39C00154G0002 [uncultured bacterium]|nr:MAG: hypothetical protein ACD_39C00154G0002 [uncultured bacterium]
MFLAALGIFDGKRLYRQVLKVFEFFIERLDCVGFVILYADNAILGIQRFHDQLQAVYDLVGFFEHQAVI